MAFSLTGVHVPHRKNTRKGPVARLDHVQTVTIPMSMHIGKPAIPTVKVGDQVAVGTKIGEPDGNFSSPVYASVSGTVKKITEVLLYGGTTTTAVVIESDGLMTPAEGLTPPTVNTQADLVDAIRTAGIVGLGGAGFPTHVKFDTAPGQAEYLIINGAECEPYVTSDTVTMTTRTTDMAVALQAIARCMGIPHVIFGIEDNKAKAIASVRRMAAELTDCNVTVKVLPTRYPQGGEKVLVYTTTGRVIPAGQLPLDVGCIVINCTTLAAIGAYLTTGMPLVEKCVTVDGGAVKNPQNVIAPIGTPLADLFTFCGGLTTDPAKLVYGGPMMGVTVPDDSYTVLKNSNAVLALTKKEAKLPKTTACIRCGACTNTCPFGLAPAAIAKAYDNKDAAALTELSVTSCMECGCCSFICPANRPLVQKNKLAKAFLQKEKAKEGV